MTSLEKIHLAVEELRARGVRKSVAAPLPYRLLWRTGFAIPPPLFQSFLGLLILHGVFFGVILGAILACADRRLAPDGATLLGTVSGAIFGLVMATHFRVEARRLGLPPWGDFPYGTGTEEDEGW
jgi:prepilin signal peptidase PulO-like enzyme (type II secretory pathway)